MAINKDYANKKKISSKSRAPLTIKKKKGRSILSNLNYIFVMVILVGGLFAVAIFYLEYIQNFTVNSRKNQHVDAKKIKQQEVITASKKQPKFEFYYTLPKMEVAVNKSEYSTAKSDELALSKKVDRDNIANVNDNLAAKIEGKQPIQDNNSNSYVLQIASFKELKDANQLRAKLILVGFDVVVQSVQLDTGETWHRVKTNKVSNIAKAEDLSVKLQEHNIKSMILTEKNYG